MGATTGASRPRVVRMLFPIGLVLVAWAFRLCMVEEVPPGWRDDELINMHALSAQVLGGARPIYFAGASGHEPLFHYLQAGVQAVAGVSAIGGHYLPASLGVVSVLLTYVVASRLLGRGVAVVSGLALSTSFWSLMYSRVGLRHISVAPFALTCVLLLWRGYVERGSRTRSYAWLGAAMGLSLYTYFASRLIPLIAVGFLVYLLLVDRDGFRRQWRGIVLALALAAAVVAPMATAIVRDVGSDPRIAELAVPVHALLTGDPRPLIETTLGTLGMFTTTGDPEWLYNLPGRPVFTVVAGVLLWTGVAVCVARWRSPAHALVLWWFALGLSPGFVSIPAASLGHTIIAQSPTYILVALAIVEIGALSAAALRRARSQVPPLLRGHHSVATVLAILIVATGAYRDLRDYFLRWPAESLVRFLYRADYRDLANYLDNHAEVSDVAVGSTLLGPWDRLAVEVDAQREDIRIRLFDPDRAMIWTPSGSQVLVAITDFPDPGRPFDAFLGRAEASSRRVGRSTLLYALPGSGTAEAALCGTHADAGSPDASFENGFVLDHVCLPSADSVDGSVLLLAFWKVARALDASPKAVAAYPPPPGVYVGPRLAGFAHLLSSAGSPTLVDDGLWVDAATLRAGDRFAQVHRFALGDGVDNYESVEMGLYDPYSGERVQVLSSTVPALADRIRIPLGSIAVPVAGG